MNRDNVAILAVLILMYNGMSKRYIHSIFQHKLFKNLFIVSLVLTLIMVILGTQVREQIDEIAKTDLLRTEWTSELDFLFIIHRSLIWLVFGLNGYLIYTAIKMNWRKSKWISVGTVILIQALIGILFSHFGFPKVAQPLHLVLSAVLFAIQFDLLIKLFRSKDDLGEGLIA